MRAVSGSPSPFIRALLLFRCATVLLLKSALTRSSSLLLRSTLLFCCPTGSGLISARGGGWGCLWRASSRALGAVTCGGAAR